MADSTTQILTLKGTPSAPAASPRLPRARRGRWLPAGRVGRTLFFLILAAGALARLWQLGRESFWEDEVYSANIVEGPVARILNRIPPDKPPLDYYVQAFFHHLLKSPEVSHRLPAALAGVVMLVGLYVWARGWFGRRTALVAMALAAFNPLFLHYSREARPYSLFLALTVWQQALFGAWLRAWFGSRAQALRMPEALARHRRRLAVGLALLSIVMLYTLYATLLVLAGQMLALLAVAAGAWLAARARTNPASAARPRTFFPCAIFAALAGLTLLCALPLWTRSQLEPPKNFFWRFEDLSVHRVSLYISETVAFGLKAEEGRDALACAAIFLFLLGAMRLWARGRKAFWQIAFTSLAPLPVSLLIYQNINRAFFIRYAIYIVPGLCLLLALGLIDLTRFAPRARWRWLLPLLLVVHAAAGFAVLRENIPSRTDWRLGAMHIAQSAHPGDRVIVQGNGDKTCMLYYLRRYHAPLEVLVLHDLTGQQTALGPTWMVAHLLGTDRPASKPFYGLKIERVGGAPADDKLDELARALGDPPTLILGKAPLSLIGEGWSAPEAWSPDFVIRWATRLRTSLLLPLRAPAAGRLTVDLMPYSEWKGAPAQWVQLTINGRPMEKRELKPGSFANPAWDVPAEAVKAGFNRIELSFAWVHSPAAEKKNYGDFRTLAAAVVRVKWEK